MKCRGKRDTSWNILHSISFSFHVICIMENWLPLAQCILLLGWGQLGGYLLHWRGQSYRWTGNQCCGSGRLLTGSGSLIKKGIIFYKFFFLIIRPPSRPHFLLRIRNTAGNTILVPLWRGDVETMIRAQLCLLYSIKICFKIIWPWKMLQKGLRWC